MQDTIQWLINVEEKAGAFYEDAAHYFEKDPALSRLLSHMAEDEAWHAHLIKQAADIVDKKGVEFQPAICLDQAMKTAVENAFIENSQRLSSGSLTTNNVINCLIDTEFSEWNNIFIYIMQSFKKIKEFKRAASPIQAHIWHVKAYIQSLPDNQHYLEKIRRLPAIWKEKLLVVDDQPEIATLLKALFGRDFDVACAENGAAALQHVNESYFDVIISDINMPVLNGLEFYKKATEFYPSIGRRFLFYSGGLPADISAFVNKHDVHYLTKPSSIRKIRDTVQGIVKESRGTRLSRAS